MRYLRPFSRQILKEAVISGDVCLTVLEAHDEQLINDTVDTKCEAELKLTVDQVRNVIIIRPLRHMSNSLNCFQSDHQGNITPYIHIIQIIFLSPS